MGGLVCNFKWEVNSLMQEADKNLKPNPSMKFKFLSNSINRLKYLYDNLNAT